MQDIAIALISAGSSIFVGLMTLFGVIITNSKANSKIEKQLEIAQAVTDEKIQELTREVREHNNFAQRMPVVEEQIRTIKANVEELRGYHKGA